jgi:hypothetical protein
MIKITEFKNALRQIARPNRFMVSINPPAAYSHQEDMRNMRFHVQAAQIPAKTIGEAIVKYHGMELRLPGDSQHDDLTVTFLNNSSWGIRNFFEGWNQLIHNVTSKSEKNIRVDSVTVITDAYVIVEQIGDSESQVLARYKFWNVFPKSVGDIELNMETIDTAETFQVIFAYSHHEQLGRGESA